MKIRQVLSGVGDGEEPSCRLDFSAESGGMPLLRWHDFVSAPLGRSDHRSLEKTFTCKGFTLVEILVVVTIIAILAALIFPLASKMVAEGHKAKCTSNLRQISAAIMSYAADNDGKIVPDFNGEYRWAELLQVKGYLNTGVTEQNFSQAVKPSGSLICPSARIKFDGTYWVSADKGGRCYGSTYGLNRYVSYYNEDPTRGTFRQLRLQGISKPANLYLLTDSHGTSVLNYPHIPEVFPVKIHNGAANILFCDGHVETVKDIPVTRPPWDDPDYLSPW